MGVQPMFTKTPDDSVSFLYEVQLGGEVVCEIEGIARITDIRPRMWEIDVIACNGARRPLNDPQDPLWQAIRSAIEDYLITKAADDVWEARRRFYQGVASRQRVDARQAAE